MHQAQNHTASIADGSVATKNKGTSLTQALQQPLPSQELLQAPVFTPSKDAISEAMPEPSPSSILSNDCDDDEVTVSYHLDQEHAFSPLALDQSEQGPSSRLSHSQHNGLIGSFQSSYIPKGPSAPKALFEDATCPTPTSEAVKRVYGTINALTGEMGGCASGGAIFGELTMGSFDKLVQKLIVQTNLGPTSCFLDVGSGLGKPNFHVAQYPGVRLSMGIELIKNRWLLSMNVHRQLFQLAKIDRSIKVANCILIDGDIENSSNFNPFTHVYMFSIGFPENLWHHIAYMWNQSSSPYLICFLGLHGVQRYQNFSALK